MKTDNIIGFLLALYLLIIIYNGNGYNFIDEILKEKKYIKFGGSILILNVINNELNIGLLGQGFIYAAFLALFINTSNETTNIFNNINKIIAG